MNYSFNMSFQEWAKAHSVPCSCGANTSPSNHKDGCPTSTAFCRWLNEGKQLYATFPKPTEPESTGAS